MSKSSYKLRRVFEWKRIINSWENKKPNDTQDVNMNFLSSHGSIDLTWWVHGWEDLRIGFLSRNKEVQTRDMTHEFQREVLSSLSKKKVDHLTLLSLRKCDAMSWFQVFWAKRTEMLCENGMSSTVVSQTTIPSFSCHFISCLVSRPSLYLLFSLENNLTTTTIIWTWQPYQREGL